MSAPARATCALLALLILGSPATTGTAHARKRAVAKRYTLRVIYKGERTEKGYLGGTLVYHRFQTTTWRARSAHSFKLLRRGSARKPAYSFKAKLSGPVEHSGHGAARFYYRGLNEIGPCWQQFQDSAPDRTALRATLRSTPSRVGKKAPLRLKFTPDAGGLTVSQVYSATPCAVSPGPPTSTVLPELTLHGIHAVGPDRWRVTYEQRDIRFGHSFTLRRMPFPMRTVTVSPATNPLLASGEMKTVAVEDISFVMRFKPGGH